MGGAGVLADGGGVRRSYCIQDGCCSVRNYAFTLATYIHESLSSTVGRACRETTQGGPWVWGRFGVHGRWSRSNNSFTKR